MTADLRATYADVRNVIELNNAGFLEEGFYDAPARHCADEIVMGHLSNLSAEKGLKEVVALAAEFTRHHPRSRLIVAGPVMTTEAADTLARAAAELGPRFVYLGPVYGKEKLRFFESITHFIFPSRDEASPLVLYEALAANVPTAAVDVGAISDVVGDTGYLCESDREFASGAFAWLETYAYGQPDATSQRKRFENLVSEHQIRAAQLVSSLTGSEPRFPN